MPTRIRGICTGILACALGVCVLSVPGVASADAMSSALNECAGIASDSDRLRCFDAVAAMAADRVSGSQTVSATTAVDEAGGVTATNKPDASGAAAATTATVTQAAMAPLTDDVGIERVKGAQKEEPPEYAAVVTRCERNPQSEQLYFFFENGQVWKQNNYRRLSYRDCRFEVTLSKDAFGYEMYVPSKDRTVRVTRIR